MIKQKNQKSKARSLVDRIFIILVAILGVLLIFVGISVFQGKTPSIFGYSILNVKTGSMETAIPTGSVILVKNIEQSEVELLQENQDIVVYYSNVNGAPITVTHRVIENNQSEKYLITKGDANASDDGEIEYSRVRAKYVRTLCVLTFCYNFLTNIWGFLFIIILPSVVLLISYIISIAKQSVKISTQKEEEIENARLEEIKKKAVEEFIRNNGTSEVVNNGNTDPKIKDK